MLGTDSALQQTPLSLGSTLKYLPRQLAYGTSGRRGLVTDLTQLEIYVCARAELAYLQSIGVQEGGIVKGDEFYFAYDLRPSSTQFVASQGGRGEIAQAIQRAIADAGMRPVNCGCIPTPALANYALQRGKGSIMVTGSHIPFDRNGYKTNTSSGELLKEHEAPITTLVNEIREQLLNEPAGDSIFNDAGMLKTGHTELLPAEQDARAAYIRRYLEFFPADALAGMRVVAYQHSAVGRDLLVEILLGLGAEVFPAGRSEEFVPIDTENIDATRLAAIQALADEVSGQHGAMDAVVSTDGDSDRPLLLGIEPESRRVRFYGGDLLGMAVAEYLKADAVVVPISCNDGIDRGPLGSALEPKTRIGSPYVIAGMTAAIKKNKKCVCGWEANGGFLVGSEVTLGGRTLRPLPTRDAMLPLLCVLSSAREKRMDLCTLFARLPERFSRAGILKEFPRPKSLAIVRRFSPATAGVLQASFREGSVQAIDAQGAPLNSAEVAEALLKIRARLGAYFASGQGFGTVAELNYLDGIRITFENGEVVHLRPSGNADELRIYAVADTAERAEAIIALGTAEPDGILRRMERDSA